jgi:5'-methylthioadenosine phosphorylase
VLDKCGRKFHDNAVYAVTEGPRLETADEVRMIARLGGELVGMTLAPESFLARELEICYHPLCYVTNWAEGVKDLPFQGGELFDGMLEEERRQRVDAAVAGFCGIVRELALRHELNGKRDCPCSQAMLRYRRQDRIGDDWHEWIGVPDGNA